MAVPAPRPRPNTHRIPSTVNPRDMVQIENESGDEDGVALSEDGSDQEYVQSEAEEDLPLPGENRRPRVPRRGGITGRTSRAQAARAGPNFIDEREDDEEGEYENDSSGDEPEVRLLRKEVAAGQCCLAHDRSLLYSNRCTFCVDLALLRVCQFRYCRASFITVLQSLRAVAD